jgi:hypothetical protein
MVKETPPPAEPVLLPPRLEVRPKVLRNLVFFLGAWVVMVGASIFLILYEKGGIVVWGAGLVGLLFFVPVGLYGLLVVFPGQLKRPVSLVITFTGLERHTENGTAFIPWQDVAEIGILKVSGNHLLGLRLSSYDHYLNNLTAPVAHDFNRTTAISKMLHRLIGMGSSWNDHEARELWSRLAGTADLAGALKETGDLGALAEMHLISRQTWGYDLLFAWSDLDRPAKKLAVLLEAYRQGIGSVVSDQLPEIQGIHS